MAPVMDLEFVCHIICVDIHLGWEREMFIWSLAVLVSFDVLEVGAEW
jgi:hypothetical protein